MLLGGLKWYMWLLRQASCPVSSLTAARVHCGGLSSNEVGRLIFSHMDFLHRKQRTDETGSIISQCWCKLCYFSFKLKANCNNHATTSSNGYNLINSCVLECVGAQSCPALHNLMDCSPPGSSVHGISQARIPEWLPFPPPGIFPARGLNLCLSCLLHWRVGSLPPAPPLLY